MGEAEENMIKIEVKLDSARKGELPVKCASKDKQEVGARTATNIFVSLHYNSPLNYVCSEHLQNALKSIPAGVRQLMKHSNGFQTQQDFLLSGAAFIQLEEERTKDFMAARLAELRSGEKAATNDSDIANLNFNVTIDLTASHYCDLDGLNFLDKGCKLLEKQEAEDLTAIRVQITGLAGKDRFIDRVAKQAGPYLLDKTVDTQAVSIAYISAESSDESVDKNVIVSVDAEAPATKKNQLD